MVTEISWLIKDHVLHAVVRGDVDLEEADAANAVLLELLNAADHPLHLIADTHDIGKYPLDPLKLRQSQTYLQHQNMGMAIVVGMNSVLRYLTSMLSHLGVLRLQSGQTLQHALKVIYENVPDLSDYPVQEIPIKTIVCKGEMQ